MGRCVVIALCVVGFGCGASRQSAYLADPKAPQTKAAGDPQGLTAQEQQADAQWEQRGSTAALKRALQLYKGIVAVRPDHRHALERLARGYYLLAYGHYTEEQQVLDAYDEGARWGERIMGLRAEFRQRIAGGDKDYEALAVAKKEDAPGIYWAYANLGKWSVLKGFTTVLKNKSKLKAFIDKVAQLDPRFYHGAADRGLGAYYAKAPSFAGGDLDKAQQHFKRALALSPAYLGTKVLMAEYYAVKRQDKALFKRLLDEVLGADPQVLPDVAPIQRIEQRRAKKLLAKIDDLFE